jgi:hypothetical protein
METITPLKVSDVAMRMMINTLWQRLSKKSFISGLWLRVYENTPLFANCFMHVLPINKYPYLKYFFGNIILCSPGEHGLWTQGTEEERIAYSLDIEERSRGTAKADWQAVRELETDLKAMYKKSFPSTRGILLDYRYSSVEQHKIVSHLNKDFWDGFK